MQYSIYYAINVPRNCTKKIVVILGRPSWLSLYSMFTLETVLLIFYSKNNSYMIAPTCQALCWDCFFALYNKYIFLDNYLCIILEFPMTTNVFFNIFKKDFFFIKHDVMVFATVYTHMVSDFLVPFCLKKNTTLTHIFI